MPALYPFLILPEFHERVWGTRDLRPYFSRVVEAEPVGEVWLTGEDLPCRQWSACRTDVADLAAQHGAAITGEAAPQVTRFPLLIKFLFPRQKLSVQVHPDDAGARLRRRRHAAKQNAGMWLAPSKAPRWVSACVPASIARCSVWPSKPIKPSTC